MQVSWLQLILRLSKVSELSFLAAMAMMGDESWRLEMRKTIEGCIARLDEMMAQWRKDDVNEVKQESEKMIDNDGETHIDDFNPVKEETEVVDEPKIIVEIENEAEVEKVCDQVVKLEPIVVLKTTHGEALYEPADEDASSESTKGAAEAIWPNKSQSKGISPLHQELGGQEGIMGSLKINSTKPKLLFWQLKLRLQCAKLVWTSPSMSSQTMTFMIAWPTDQCFKEQLPKLSIKFILQATGNISAKFPYNQVLVDAFCKIPKATWNAKERLWMFPLSTLSSAEKVLYEISSCNVEVENLHPLVQRVIAAPSALPNLQDWYDRIPIYIESKLLPFQRDGVRYVLQHGGRALLADEMGLGKTLQAIAVAASICDSWLVLILAPFSLHLHWTSMIQQWLNIHLDGLFNIISYVLVVKLENVLMASKFKVVIADESHFLKNAQTKRTIVSLSIIKKAQYVILLSGTPALCRPIELFKQLEALYPNVYRKVYECSERYCKGEIFGIYQAASNHEELHKLMKALGGDIKKVTYVGKLFEGISYACNLSNYIALGFGFSYNQLIVKRNGSYVFDMYYQVKSQHLWGCDFSKLALVTNKNELVASEEVQQQMDTLLADTSLTSLLKNCFDFDTFSATDVQIFGDGEIFNGNFRKPIEEVILVLEKKLTDVVGKEVISWFMKEKMNGSRILAYLVQLKSEMDFQIESTKLSTLWEYVNEIVLCVAIFVINCFNVVPLFDSLVSILGVFEMATNASFVADDSFTSGDNVVFTRPRSFYNHLLHSFIQIVIKSKVDDFGNALPSVVKRVGVSINLLSFAGLLRIVVVVLIKILKPKYILMAEKEKPNDGNQFASTLPLNGRIVFQAQLGRICLSSLICSTGFMAYILEDKDVLKEGVFDMCHIVY